MTRKQLFKISLIVAGITQGEFCRINKVDVSYIHYTLRGAGSKRMNDIIDNCINTNIYKLKTQLNEAA